MNIVFIKAPHLRGRKSLIVTKSEPLEHGKVFSFYANYSRARHPLIRDSYWFNHHEFDILKIKEI